MKFVQYGHRHGDLVIPPAILKTIIDAIESADVKIARGSSPAIKKSILDNLLAHGWSDELVLSAQSRITITSVKDQVGLCFQTGNMGRMYADLLKLQALYLRETIKAAAMILPTGECARNLGENLANSDRLVGELDIFERVISIPLVILGLE